MAASSPLLTLRLSCSRKLLSDESLRSKEMACDGALASWAAVWSFYDGTRQRQRPGFELNKIPFRPRTPSAGMMMLHRPSFHSILFFFLPLSLAAEIFERIGPRERRALWSSSMRGLGTTSPSLGMQPGWPRAHALTVAQYYCAVLLASSLLLLLDVALDQSNRSSEEQRRAGAGRDITSLWLL